RQHAECLVLVPQAQHQPLARAADSQRKEKHPAEPRGRPRQLDHAARGKHRRERQPYPAFNHCCISSSSAATAAHSSILAASASSHCAFSVISSSRRAEPEEASIICCSRSADCCSSWELSRSSVFSCFCRFLVPPVRLGFSGGRGTSSSVG